MLITYSIPEAVFPGSRILVMIERPGAIDAIYEVPLPRPRSASSSLLALHHLSVPAPRAA